ncbi:MAG: Uma2 family endonuclease [Blastocatellia bacterium]
MSAIIETPILESKEIVKEKHIVLSNISWSTYESLLNDLADKASARLTYDQGKLEIMVPLPEHEWINRNTALIVDVIAEELNINIQRLGSTTFKSQALTRGFEPDSCFYIQHQIAIQGKKHIDLAIDPPPDLVVEIDITSSSTDKLPFYHSLGVSEIWLHNGQELTIYKIEQNNYQIANSSVAFPLLTSQEIGNFINQSRNLPSLDFLKSLRAFLRDKINTK